jgi:hypothetical protein
MLTKVFRVVSISKKLFSADMLAEVLLKHVTLNTHGSKAIFAVMECQDKRSRKR